MTTMIDGPASAARNDWAMGASVGVLVLGAAATLAAGFMLSRGARPAQAAVAAGGLLVVASLVHRIGWRSLPLWIVLCGPLFPFVRYPSQHALGTFDRIWIGGMLIAIIASARSSSARRPTRLLFTAFVWLMVASGLRAITTTGVNSHLSIVTTWFDAFLLPCALFVAARRVTFSSARVIAVAKALAAAGLLLSLIGIAEQLVGFQLATRSGGTVITELGGLATRSTGPFTYPEMQATAVLVCLAATLFLVQLRIPRWYTVGGIAVILELTAIGLTLFRTAWIAAAVVVVIGLALRPRRVIRLAATAILAIALGVAALGPLQSNQVTNERLNNVHNVYSRLGTYVDGLHIFLHHPIFGAGVTQFGTAEANLGVRATINGGAALGSAHDSFINIAAEQGLWGFIPLLVLAFGATQMLRRYRRIGVDRVDILFAAAAIGAVLAYVLMSATETMILEEIPNAFFALILGAAAGRVDALVSAAPVVPRHAREGAWPDARNRE
jgi:O-antigen ligase